MEKSLEITDLGMDDKSKNFLNRLTLNRVNIVNTADVTGLLQKELESLQ